LQEWPQGLGLVVYSTLNILMKLLVLHYQLICIFGKKSFLRVVGSLSRIGKAQYSFSCTVKMQTHLVLVNHLICSCDIYISYTNTHKHQVFTLKVDTIKLCYNALPGTEEKELYSRESAITGKNLPGSFLENRTTYRDVRAPGLDEPIL
jgi:hypothetical protein